MDVAKVSRKSTPAARERRRALSMVDPLIREVYGVHLLVMTIGVRCTPCQGRV